MNKYSGIKELDALYECGHTVTHRNWMLCMSVNKYTVTWRKCPLCMSVNKYTDTEGLYTLYLGVNNYTTLKKNCILCIWTNTVTLIATKLNLQITMFLLAQDKMSLQLLPLWSKLLPTFSTAVCVNPWNKKTLVSFIVKRKCK